MGRKPRILLAVIVVVVLLAVWSALAWNCPSEGIAFTHHARELHRLKNRTALPQPADFDTRVTVESLLQPGNDASRWSTDRAARLQGFVIDVAYARPEAANCFSPCRRDIHILIANRKEAAKSEQIVLEVTPNLREWAVGHGFDWSAETLKAQLVNHWCEFEGWLYFDLGHEEESENVAPGNSSNWRATGWELHPVTKFTVVR